MFLTAVILTAGGCASTAGETTDVGASQESVPGDNTTETESLSGALEESEMTDEELKKFASGVESETQESISETESGENKLVLTGEIEMECPILAYAPRAGVKYGEFTHATYESTTCGVERGYSILLPTDYSQEKSYPVLYLLHGIFGDEYSFASDGTNRIKEIVANMAADGIIEETIVVCPNMYATGDPNLKPGFNAESIQPYDNFINDLVTDLMPHIESTYSVKTGRENTMLAGFSMGGRETLFICQQRPELFGYVCSISAAPGVTPGKDWAMEHPGQLAEDELKFAKGAQIPEVLIVCCGTKDSVVGTFPKSYHEIMERNGMPHTWYEIKGADHDNNAIRSGLYNLFMQWGRSFCHKECPLVTIDYGMVCTLVTTDCGKVCT